VKLTYVTVRYGPQILGGAEQACRQLAEHLAADGAEVDVHTTCALDSVTWADELPAGTTVEAGVTVHRHRSTSGRDASFETFSTDVLADPPRQTAATERRWLELQGPVCPDAVEGALRDNADLLLATPYLYWPIVEAARHAPRLVLHPAAHEEPPIHLPMFRDTFAGATGLAYYTDAERRLVERLWPDLTAKPQLAIGLGVDLPEAATAAPPTDRPYILCLGRVDDGKGTRVLARFFATYKRRRPGPLALVFAGPVVHRPDDHPDVIVSGPLTEAAKTAALAQARALVSPSAHESFSIVLLEGWAAGTPALVNARCGPTAEHARRSGGGLAFGGYAAFETALDFLLEDPARARTIGARGRAYVEQTFAWPVVTRRYRAWLEHLAASAGTAEPSTTLVRP
jgi:glycosyltransferase involved in cell wall biosynthesis